MLLIISGCDRTGKTTLCNSLKNYLNENFTKMLISNFCNEIEYKHFSAPKTKEEGYNTFTNFLNSIKDNVFYIIDRFYECENIYAPIYRNYIINYNQELDKTLRNKHKVLFIYVKSDLDIIKQRITDIGDDYININDIEQIYNNYEKYMQTIQLPYITLNNNSFTDLQNNINLIIKYINTILEKDYFGNLQADKAIIFSNKINNPYKYILENINSTDKLNMMKNKENTEENGDYIFTFTKNLNQSVNYTEYFYTNNENNVNILDINERLYVNF